MTNQTKFSYVAGALFCAILLALIATTNAGPTPKEIEPVPAAPEFNWTGLYIGGNLGGFWSNYSFREHDTDVDVDAQFDEFTDPAGGFPFSTSFGTETFTAPSTSSTSDGSPMGGGQLGFQYQFGRLVLGIEADFDRVSTARDTSFQSSIFNEGEGTIIATTDLTTMRRAETDWTASARARVGWARDRVLLYVTGGGAFAHVRTWASDTVASDFIITAAGTPDHLGIQTDSNQSVDSDILTGWTAGGGAEWAMNDYVTVGLEYRHSDYGDQTFHFSAHPTSSGEVVIFPGSTRVSTDSDQVEFKVNVNLCRFFGWRH